MAILVLIPARLGSTRLPSKALADIAGKPMVVRVAERAQSAQIGRVVVATDAEAIRDAVTEAGFEAVMTSSEHQSGSDRIFEALTLVDPDKSAETIVNVQGDLPTIEPEAIRQVLAPFEDPRCDVATLAVEITEDAERTNPNVVKLVGSPIGPTRMRALYFTRATAPWGEGPHYHHVGLYAYRRPSLERFVSLSPSVLERREKLEQLRTLEDGMRIDAEIVDAVPLGVDAPGDLERARQMYGV
ncbi:3-deoxy-manno-octulosonate cytidylyltransferase [Aurantimonas sp. VKM B-3413]|uniref:3-deoxy-manno-octulosonate cytidylyltransferase n=1 Tax=Aurantimonas sp. VKM B-3413 TaxID=2779401 RepID=UPI001E43F2F5|nr:3-deoxy-manno-octulosonate cytidylyltransferase [Aurantimonas sp. VKM B-3413]MCB8837169.1 3-deoxy-manno-octulosonate cytidylyltransferase [Aurantimonas sp. VKM B-3413]